MSKPPTLDAYAHPDGIHYVVFCPDCRLWHWHSAEDGHRAAHCASHFEVWRHGEFIGLEENTGALQQTGYVLKCIGPLTKAARDQHAVRRGYAFKTPRLSRRRAHGYR